MSTIKQQAFTLLEILIALVIFVIIAGITASSLFLMIKSKRINSEHAKQLAQWQIALSLLQNDTRNMIERPIRAANLKIEPALWLRDDDGLQLAITRKNNLYSSKQVLQLTRVNYRLNHRQLIRDVWPVLDRAPNSKPVSRVLLTHVNKFTIKIIDQQQHSNSIWPSTDQQQQAISLNVTICVKQQSCIQQTIAIAKPYESTTILPVTR